MHHTYLNGNIKPSQDTVLGITDLSLLRGYGLFDYFRTYNGQPFQWDLYWTRYQNSARMMGLENPISKEDAHEIVLKLLKMSSLDNAAFRFILTGGYSADSFTMTKPNLLISSEDIHPVAQSQYQIGIKVIAYEYLRDLPEIKSIDYKHLMMAQPSIKAAAATDILLHKNGEISELSRSNLFIFKNGVLITPNRHILNGITRQVTLKLAKPYFKIEERPLSMAEFLEADEVFTTSSTKKILPVTALDEHAFSNAKIGKQTAFLLNLIEDLTEKWG